MLIKKIYIKVDDKREMIEDFIADNILKRWDELKNVNDLRETAVLAVINTVGAYINCYGLPSLTDTVKERIAKSGAKVLKNMNNKLQKQLKKKSKAYLKRHGE